MKWFIPNYNTLQFLENAVLIENIAIQWLHSTSVFIVVYFEVLFFWVGQWRSSFSFMLLYSADHKEYRGFDLDTSLEISLEYTLIRYILVMPLIIKC